MTEETFERVARTYGDMLYRVAYHALKNRADAEDVTQTVLLLSLIHIFNTCGFIDSAKSEAIQNILELAELKKEGKLGKLLVTGCLSQRYQDELMEELPEVDGVMGTGSYTEIVPALEELMAGGTPHRFGDIDHTEEMCIRDRHKRRYKSRFHSHFSLKGR